MTFIQSSLFLLDSKNAEHRRLAVTPGIQAVRWSKKYGRSVRVQNQKAV